MKRFGIFALLGPFLGAVLILSLGSVYDGKFLGLHEAQKILLTAYQWGIIPACVCAVVDWWLRKFSWRISTLGAVGYVATALSTLVIGQDLAEYMYLVAGLVGVIPAAVCSWLSSEKK